jgi:hypothetical protein
MDPQFMQMAIEMMQAERKRRQQQYQQYAQPMNTQQQQQPQRHNFLPKSNPFSRL